MKKSIENLKIYFKEVDTNLKLKIFLLVANIISLISIPIFMVGTIYFIYDFTTYDFVSCAIGLLMAILIAYGTYDSIKEDINDYVIWSDDV